MFNEAVSLATTVAQNHQLIRELLARFWDRLTRGHTRVVILGGGGVGKTTLGHLLEGDDGIDPRYRESTEVESYRLPGGTSCTVLVPPGQDRLRDATWTQLDEYIAKNRTVVVHAVDYGLREISPLPYTALDAHDDGMGPTQTLEAFAKHQRQGDELAVVERLARLPQPNKMRLVTVVTKQDLWWRWRHDVRQHYVSGAYNAKIDELRARIGTRRFHHTLWSTSMIMKNLVDGEGTVLLTTSDGYDEPRRLWHQQRLLEILEDAARHV